MTSCKVMRTHNLPDRVTVHGRGPERQTSLQISHEVAGRREWPSRSNKRCRRRWWVGLGKSKLTDQSSCPKQGHWDGTLEHVRWKRKMTDPSSFQSSRREPVTDLLRVLIGLPRFAPGPMFSPAVKAVTGLRRPYLLPSAFSACVSHQKRNSACALSSTIHEAPDTCSGHVGRLSFAKNSDSDTPVMGRSIGADTCLGHVWTPVRCLAAKTAGGDAGWRLGESR